MFEKLFTSKKILITISILILLIAAVIVGVVLNDNSEDVKKPDVNIESGEVNNDVDNSESTGLDVQEGNEILDDTTQEDSTDVPSSRDDSQKDGNDKTNSSDKDNNQKEDIGSSDNGDIGGNGGNDDDNNESDEDVLKDEKTWGEIF